MSYKLINADESDINRLIEYKQNTIFEHANNLSLDEINNIKKYVNEQIIKKQKHYKIITIDGIKAGCLLVENKDDGVILDEVYIEDRYRNKGVGTSIIEKIISSNNIVYLWVYKLNKRAISLYKKLGFIVIDETESRYYMKYDNI